MCREVHSRDAGDAQGLSHRPSRSSCRNCRGVLLCDATISQRTQVGSVIGMQAIKERRLRHSLTSAEGVNVGDCVPFYFCPRSVMLYLIYRRNHPDLHYRGGQEEILHLEIDLLTAVKWANDHNRRWAITKSNAGAAYFEDFSDLQRIDELDWGQYRRRIGARVQSRRPSRLSFWLRQVSTGAW